ncbi:MAG: DUF1460 domain-containing protein [Elusimicrobia bacterium]|nr:DUF1460 domain-containing protein [Elusimicrobiota bacterium]
MRPSAGGAAALCFFMLCACSADDASVTVERFHRMSREEIARTLRDIHDTTPHLEGRIMRVSERFLDTPYRRGPLGEGPSGEFDTDPLINFQAADCTTLVEQVMALSLEPDLDRAGQLLQKIRYKGGKISYLDRNHFPETDWIPNNISTGFLKDITRLVGGGQTRIATKVIDKTAWYAAKTEGDLAGFEKALPKERRRRLARMRELGARFQTQRAELPYVPVDVLPQVLDRVPNGTIANLVREDAPDKPLMVSHQVFLILKGRAWYVRHAALAREVEDVPLADYFRKYASYKWRLLGVNLNSVVPVRGF